jgi:chemotaxis protein histidine kinase CheA
MCEFGHSKTFQLEIQSRPGEGTVIQIEIPQLVSAMQEVRT